MNTFKFNFLAEAIGAREGSVGEPIASLADCNAVEITFDASVSHSKFDSVQICRGCSLVKGVLSGNETANILGSGDLAATDLVPGKYEGGFKLWECAVDLGKYLGNLWEIEAREGIISSSRASALAGLRVLELGCGHGLPGILAAVLGLEVHFQDYNEEVLKCLTMPNLSANIEHLSQTAQSLPARFFSGSWASLTTLLGSLQLLSSYDIIFSTDTIYSSDSQQQLIACIAASLKPGGKAFIGAKSYYFGVGGCIQAFKKAATRTGQLTIESVQCISDGSSNMREILLLSKL